MNEKNKDMDEKSTRNSEKVKDVEVDTIERSIRMKEETKTKIHEKLIVRGKLTLRRLKVKLTES